MKRLIVLLLFSGCCMTARAESVIISAVEQSSDGSTTEGKGTAACIFSNDRGSILLTCKHIIQRSSAVWVRTRGNWHQCRIIASHPSEDVAILETDAQIKSHPLAADMPDGSEVVVDGAGPSLHRTNEDWYFRGIATQNQVHNEAGLAVIEGDSGGPVYVRCADGYAVGGIAYGYPGEYRCSRRADHRGRGAVTLYTPCSAFLSWVETQYGCGPQGCPIQIRRQVVQPVGPLGFPRGPARVIGVAEPVQPQYVPVQPQSQSVVCGPRGPAGPPGRDGRSVQQAEVEATVNAWLEANIDRMRGPAGPAGRDGSSADVSGLVSRLTELEQRKFRIIISSDGKTVDDETYAPGEPVVLDLKRLRSVSGGK